MSKWDIISFYRTLSSYRHKCFALIVVVDGLCQYSSLYDLLHEFCSCMISLIDHYDIIVEIRSVDIKKPVWIVYRCPFLWKYWEEC
jgi:hypothetical protein